MIPYDERCDMPARKVFPGYTKRCSKCNKVKSVNEFNKDRGTKDELHRQCRQCVRTYFRNWYNHPPIKEVLPEGMKRCTQCKQIQSVTEFHKRSSTAAGYKPKCKSCRSSNKKQYTTTHKVQISAREERRRKGPASFSTYVSKFNTYEQRESADGKLEVPCKHCGLWFQPSLYAVTRHIDSVTGRRGGEANLYCSDKCKQKCSTFNRYSNRLDLNSKQLDPDHELFNPELHAQWIGANTYRPDQAAWRKLVLQEQFDRLGKQCCEICEIEDVPFVAHHIEPVKRNPTLSADIDNGIVLCKECDKKVHKLPGCSYSELRVCVLPRD